MWINQMSSCQHKCHLSVPAGHVWISGNLWLLNSEWIIIIMLICNLKSKFALLYFWIAPFTSICQATIKVPTSYTGAEVRPAMGQWFYMTAIFLFLICHHASAMLHGMFNDLYVRSMHIDLCKCCKCLLLVDVDIAVIICFCGNWWKVPRSASDQRLMGRGPHRYSEKPQAETLPEQGSGNWVGQALSGSFWTLKHPKLCLEQNWADQVSDFREACVSWQDSMDFIFPIMSWIPYIYCYPLPWGCPCCFPLRKQHLDSCRWMMSKQAPWSWFSRCSMIASHHFLTIFSGCTGGKVFQILWKNKRALLDNKKKRDGNGVLTGCFHWLSIFFLEAPWRFIHRRNARRWHVWQAFLRRGLHEVSKFVSIRFPYSSAWKRGNTSLSVLGIIRSCFRSLGRSSCKFHFRILPCSNIEDVWLKDPKLLCNPENIHLSFPSICPRFVCCGGRSRTPLPRHSPMPSCMFPLEMILCRFMEVWRYWDIHFIDIDICAHCDIKMQAASCTDLSLLGSEQYTIKRCTESVTWIAKTSTKWFLTEKIVADCFE